MVPGLGLDERGGGGGSRPWGEGGREGGGAGRGREGEERRKGELDRLGLFLS